MFTKSFSSSIINITVISMTFLLMTTEGFAQSNKSSFNKQQCIQNLAKQGLKTTQASVWCNYEEKCLVESQNEGLSKESAQTVCKCTISEFRNKYTTEKFKQLTQQVNNNRKVARELREVGEMCFEKILFE